MVPSEKDGGTIIQKEENMKTITKIYTAIDSDGSTIYSIKINGTFCVADDIDDLAGMPNVFIVKNCNFKRVSIERMNKMLEITMTRK